MRIFIDSANLADIVNYDADPWISGFTTNATLVKRAGDPIEKLVAATSKEISVEKDTCQWQSNVRWKVTRWEPTDFQPINVTAICSLRQVPTVTNAEDILSVFAGRIMDTGRTPAPIIEAAKRTGAQVLWASSRSVWDITMADRQGCDIITVTPAIYEKHRAWHGMPLEEVATRTIAQFEADRA